MRRIVLAAALGLALVAGGPVAAAHSADNPQVEAVRSALLRLPYYGVFDFLAFSYDQGVVTLSGYAFHAPLKDDAERAVKRVAGVREVANTIEILPVSSMDDDLRWKSYYAIYSDPFLSRYAPGGGMPWGHLHRVPISPFGSGWRFPGLEPIGNYPISIIVKGGRITLMGVVDSESDKTLAGMRARDVIGSLAVENELTIHRSTS